MPVRFAFHAAYCSSANDIVCQIPTYTAPFHLPSPLVSLPSHLSSLCMLLSSFSPQIPGPPKDLIDDWQQQAFLSFRSGIVTASHAKCYLLGPDNELRESLHLSCLWWMRLHHSQPLAPRSDPVSRANHVPIGFGLGVIGSRRRPRAPKDSECSGISTTKLYACHFSRNHLVHRLPEKSSTSTITHTICHSQPKPHAHDPLSDIVCLVR